MKTRSLPAILGIAFVLVISLFSYSRSEKLEHGSISWNVDGAALAAIILCGALFVICRRIRGALRTALSRAGLSPELTIPSVYRWIICAAVPFFVIGYSSTTTTGGVTKYFGFGTSPFKLAALVLLILAVWLVALARKLGDLSEHLNRPVRPAGGLD